MNWEMSLVTMIKRVDLLLKSFSRKIGSTSVKSRFLMIYLPSVWNSLMYCLHLVCACLNLVFIFWQNSIRSERAWIGL